MRELYILKWKCVCPSLRLPSPRSRRAILTRRLDDHASSPSPIDHNLGSQEVLSLRQPPARLLATMCLRMAVRAGELIVSPSWKEIILAVLLLCPAVMMPSGSGTIAPS